MTLSSAIEAKMTNIFAIYFKASGFPSQSFLSAGVNSLGDMVPPCRTPILVLILLLSLYRWTVIELLG